MYGYAVQGHIGVVDQTVTVVTDYPDMAEAALGAVLLVLVGVLSACVVRRRLRYEVWYYLHLLTYAAVYLAFWHQLSTGAEFLGSAAARAAWYVLYGTVGALLLWYRFFTPVRLNLVHRMRVESVVPEAPRVVSVRIRGRRLHRMGAEAGHFFRWRFLTKGLYWTANPYSLSAPPRPDLLRITPRRSPGDVARISGACSRRPAPAGTCSAPAGRGLRPDRAPTGLHLFLPVPCPCGRTERATLSIRDPAPARVRLLARQWLSRSSRPERRAHASSSATMEGAGTGTRRRDSSGRASALVPG